MAKAWDFQKIQGCGKTWEFGRHEVLGGRGPVGKRGNFETACDFETTYMQDLERELNGMRRAVKAGW